MTIPKRSNVLQEVIAALESGFLIPSNHAQKQMDVRNVQLSDIEEMLYCAHLESHKDSLRTDGVSDWKYSIRGLTDDGQKDIRIIVVF